MTKVDERMLGYARALEEYCKGFGGDCTDCLFRIEANLCVLCDSPPENWSVEDLSKMKAIELLKEMRENISGLDNEAAKNKITALTMAIEVLEG